jgi:hypothetical protein
MTERDRRLLSSQDSARINGGAQRAGKSDAGRRREHLSQGDGLGTSD